MDPMLDGVLNVVDTEIPALQHVAAEAPKKETVKPETKTETKTEDKTPETKTETKTKTETPPEPEEDDEEVVDTQDFSRNLPDDDETPEETEEETEAPSNTETNTEVATTPDGEEVKFEEPPVPQFNLQPPHYNERGEIDNMTPAQYEQYLVEKAKHEFRVESQILNTENKALDAAEKILPQIKTSPAIRTMVENARTASILNGKPINSFEAAKLVKDALGLTNVDQKISQARQEGKAEGVQQTKVSITKQKAATVETKGSTTKKPETNTRDRMLTKRLQMGDSEAFVELMDQWDAAGKLS
jgi:hypothetical protein